MAAAWELRAALGQTPATALPEYREPGTLPREAQPTLRDLLSYQYVELLASRRLWPAELPPLDALAASAEAGGPVAGDRLLEARLHPLAKLAAVLQDLAGWHKAAGRSTAALAAHLERLSRLHQGLADAEARARLRAIRGNPQHYARHALKVMIKFRLLDSETMTMQALQEACAGASVLRNSAALLGLPLAEAIEHCTDELVARQQLGRAGDRLFDR
jgi:hypothetical protein